MPEFYMILVRKITRIPYFYDICPKNEQNSRILHDFCPKMPNSFIIIVRKIFSRTLGGGGNAPPPSAPPSPTHISHDDDGDDDDDEVVSIRWQNFDSPAEVYEPIDNSESGYSCNVLKLFVGRRKYHIWPRTTCCISPHRNSRLLVLVLVLV